jgi:membrane protease YdiL (CAAX protease family)
MGFTLIPFSLLLVLLLAWTKFVEGRGVPSIGVSRQDLLKTFLAGYAAGLAAMLLVVVISWLIDGFKTSSPAPVSPSVLLQITMLAPCIALQSSVEELIFRGWLLSVLTEKFNLLAGILISSAIFSLLHFDRTQPWLATTSNFLFGVFCCCCVVRWRSVVGAMGWHSGWNWLLAVGFGLPLSGLDVGIPPLIVRLEPIGATWMNGGAQGPEASAACVLFFLVSSALLLATKPPLAQRVGA